jgi:hypothetical protein
MQPHIQGYFVDNVIGRYYLHIFIIIAFTLLMFTGMPLRDVYIGGIISESIIGYSDMYGFEISLNGSNPNIVPLIVNNVDIDVFASPYMEDYEDNVKGELLGHIRTLNETTIFQPVSRKNSIVAKIKIRNPSTFGKLYSISYYRIYLTYPYILLVKGNISYHSSFDFFSILNYKIPICFVHQVFNQTFGIERNCLDD